MVPLSARAADDRPMPAKATVNATSAAQNPDGCRMAAFSLGCGDGYRDRDFSFGAVCFAVALALMLPVRRLDGRCAD